MIVIHAMRLRHRMIITQQNAIIAILKSMIGPNTNSYTMTQKVVSNAMGHQKGMLKGYARHAIELQQPGWWNRLTMLDWRIASNAIRHLLDIHQEIARIATPHHPGLQSNSITGVQQIVFNAIQILPQQTTMEIRAPSAILHRPGLMLERITVVIQNVLNAI